MQLGIHVGTFARSSLEAALDAAAAHGFECVHFNMAAVGVESMPERIDEALCRRIAEAVASRGLSIATLSATFNMIPPDRRRRGEGLRRLEVLAAEDRPMGARVLSLCTGTRDPDDMWRGHAGNAEPDAWSDLAASLEIALRAAERFDVVLGVEPETTNVVDSAARARRLLDEMRSPRLGIIIDPANLFRLEDLPRMREVLATAFELLGDDIIAAHAKDVEGCDALRFLPAGRGRLDYDLYLALLAKIGFDGALILHSLDESDAAGCAEFLRVKLRAAT